MKYDKDIVVKWFAEHGLEMQGGICYILACVNETYRCAGKCFL